MNLQVIHRSSLHELDRFAGHGQRQRMSHGSHEFWEKLGSKSFPVSTIKTESYMGKSGP